MSQPSERPSREYGGRIYRIGPALEACFLVAVIVLFNAFPEKVGLLISADDPGSFYPLLTPEFQAHVPWLTVWWGLALILAMTKLAYGFWTEAMRWAEVGVNAYGALVLIRLLQGGPILRSDRLDGWAVPLLDGGAKGIIAVLLVVLALTAAVTLIRLLTGPHTAQLSTPKGE